MAFPRPVGKPGELLSGSNSTTFAVPYPTVPGGILAGDLLVIVGTLDGSHSISNWNGFTHLKTVVDGTSTVTVTSGYLWAAGGESGTLTITSGTSERGALHMVCIRGADAGTNPAVSTGTSGNSTNPNPDSVTAWTGEDNLFLAVCGMDQSSTASPTAPPTNYAGLETAFATSGGAIGYAWRKLNGASDDPGTFTAVTEQWCAFTIAIRPDVATGGDGNRAVRSFDGTDDELRLSAAGGLASLDAAVTLAMVIKRGADGAFHNLMAGHNSGGTGVWAMEATTGDAAWFQSTSSPFTWSTAEGWGILAVTKADGTATPRFHFYSFASGNWTHGDAGAAASDLTAIGAGGTIRIGEYEDGDDFNGKVAVAGVWAAALTDAQVEELSWGEDGLGTESWTNHTVAPVSVWELNQAATTTAVEDLTATAADQTVLNGTSVETSDLPPLWRFTPAAAAGGDTATPVSYPATGVSPTAAAAVTATSAPAAGVTPTPSASATPTATSVPAAGAAPTAAATVSAATVTAIGTTPANSASATPTPGGAAATGVSPTAAASATQGTAPATGPAPTSTAAAATTQASASASGVPPTAEAAVAAASAPAAGTAPGSAVSATPAPGTATAAGAAPSPDAAVSPAAATAAGVAPTAAATVSATSNPAVGVNPTSTASATPTPANVPAAGTSPTAGLGDTPTPGVAATAATTPTAAVSLTPTQGTATATATQPTSAAAATPTPGAASTAGTAPTVTVSAAALAGTAVVTTTTPTATVTLAAAPGLAVTSGVSPTASVVQLAGLLQIAVTNRKRLNITVTNQARFNITATNRARFNIEPENRKQLNAAVENQKQLQIGVTR